MEGGLTKEGFRLGLDVLTQAFHNLNKDKLILAGGSALAFYQRKITTKDIDVVSPKNLTVIADNKLAKAVEDVCRSRKLGFEMKVKRTKEVVFYYIKPQRGRKIRIDILTGIRVEPPPEVVVEELGIVRADTINDVDVYIPTAEALFVMKMYRTANQKDLKDIQDLKYLSKLLNPIVVWRFCNKHGKLNDFFRASKLINMIRSLEEEIYYLALKLSDKTLDIALKKKGMTPPHHHDEKVWLYAQYHIDDKTEENLTVFRNYLKDKTKKRKKG